MLKSAVTLCWAVGIKRLNYGIFTEDLRRQKVLACSSQAVVGDAHSGYALVAAETGRRILDAIKMLLGRTTDAQRCSAGGRGQD